MRIDPDGGCPPPCILLAEVVITGSRIASTTVLPALTTALNVASWYAKDFGKFVTSERILNETQKGFLGATKLAGSIGYGYSGVDVRGGDYDDTALKLGQGMSILTSVYTMTPTPGGSPVFATPNGKPVTQPIRVSAPTRATDIHGRVNAGGEGKNVEKINDNQLKKSGIDAHKLKKEWLGDKAKISEYDLYKAKDTGEIIIFRKGGQGSPIFTGEFIK